MNSSLVANYSRAKENWRTLQVHTVAVKETIYRTLRKLSRIFHESLVGIEEEAVSHEITS